MGVLSCLVCSQQISFVRGGDFDSKLAFAVLQILLAFAKAANTPGAIRTIPAG
jgi:hypothetical protein